MKNIEAPADIKNELKLLRARRTYLEHRLTHKNISPEMKDELSREKEQLDICERNITIIFAVFMAEHAGSEDFEITL